MNMYLLILGMGICTFLPRYLPLVLRRNKELPSGAKALLGYVPPAVLAAIVVPALLMPAGNRIDVSPASPYLLGGIVAMACTVLSKKWLLSSGAGVLVFFLVQRLVGG